MKETHIPVSRPEEPSVFQPENLLREARRQKALPVEAVPAVCLLDPDGDIVRFLLTTGRAEKCAGWACYHTDLHVFAYGGYRFGIVGCAVGAPFAVLVAEQLFVSGCELLVSVTSSGQIREIRRPPYFILIDKALRDEGTSGHYLPPADYSHIDVALLARLEEPLASSPVEVATGAVWTTDAPFRETASAIEHCRDLGILAVEMEAAALYAFAKARNKPVVCLAHVTNRMASIEGDFEKGAANGSRDALRILGCIANAWVGTRQ